MLFIPKLPHTYVQHVVVVDLLIPGQTEKKLD